MNTETKKNLVAAVLYITLAIMIVAVVCIAVVSVAKRAKDSLPSEENTQTEDKNQQSGKQTNNTPPQTEPTKPTEPQTEPSTEAPTEPVDNQITDPIPDKFVVPALGYVSKSYDNEMPVYSLTMNDYRIHNGIDVACDVNSEVYACASGTVESIYEDPLMGQAITVYHGGGLRSTYLNLADNFPANIKEGTEVAAGQVIGYVGESALIECAEVPHLHFAMTMDEQTIDPLDYVTYEGAVSSNAVDFEG